MCKPCVPHIYSWCIGNSRWPNTGVALHLPIVTPEAENDEPSGLLAGSAGVLWGSLQGYKQMLGTVLLIILILMLLGAIPTWPHSRNWGYGPSGGLGLVLLIIIILLLLDRI